MSSEVPSILPSSLQTGIMTGALSTAAAASTSPLEAVRITYTSLPDNRGQLDLYRPRFPLENIQKALPKEASRYMPFFSLYPIAQYYTGSVPAALFTAGFFQGAVANRSSFEGLKSAARFASFFCVAAPLYGRINTKHEYEKALGVGAIAGCISSMVELSLEMAKCKVLKSKVSQLPSVGKGVISGSLAGGVLLSALVLGSKILDGKKS